ncbi:MAG: hypothetical protein K2W82_17980 [Candidatus Obscuribacterales bacterium]|nr:hypothetical protein [Candidatus Obscuribacterales bacterium]
MIYFILALPLVGLLSIAALQSYEKNKRIDRMEECARRRLADPNWRRTRGR